MNNLSTSTFYFFNSEIRDVYNNMGVEKRNDKILWIGDLFVPLQSLLD